MHLSSIAIGVGSAVMPSVVRQALALDHQADGIGAALRRMRDARRQVEDFAGADRHLAQAPLVLDA